MLKNFGKGNFKDSGPPPKPDVILRYDHEMKIFSSGLIYHTVDDPTDEVAHLRYRSYIFSQFLMDSFPLSLVGGNSQLDAGDPPYFPPSGIQPGKDVPG